MSGKKGGILQSVSRFAGFNAALDPVVGASRVVTNEVSRQEAAVEKEIKTQERIQADNEAAALDREKVAGESDKQRRKRIAQKSLALSKAGRSGTILTSPLGDSSGGGSSGPSGKTLLGV